MILIWFMNDKYSLRSQIYLTFSGVAILSIGVTLAICYGLLYGLANTAYDKASDTLASDAKRNAQATASGIAIAIEQQIQVIASSVCLMGSKYAASLMSTVSTQGQTVLATQKSYREYNFIGPCNSSLCPADYGPLKGRSRFPPDLPGFINGSLTDSSVYLFSQRQGQALSNDSAWDAYVTQYPLIQATMNGLSYMNKDMELFYNQGPNTTVMFYLSTLVPGNDGFADVVHRTFPGTYKNSVEYNPANRVWFKSAPVTGIALYGPYRETFTQQLVITISSRAVSYPFQDSINTKLTYVSAAVMLIKDLASIVNTIQYSNNGFGALLRNDANQALRVMVWGSRDDLYDEVTQNFKLLQDIDPSLAKSSLSSGTVLEYKDPHGIEWFVSARPFLKTSTYVTDVTSTVASNSLILLVFSQKSIAEASLIDLRKKIDATTSRITIDTIIIIASIVASVFVLIIFVTSYISAPLALIKHTSEQVATITAEEEEHRDYRSVINSCGIDTSRTDEAGILAADYHSVLCMLHNNHVEKLSAPKFPINPFHITMDEFPRGLELTWNGLWRVVNERMRQAAMTTVDVVQLAPNQVRESHAAAINAPRKSEEKDDNYLDVLGSLGKRSNPPPSAPGLPSYAQAQTSSFDYENVKSIETAQVPIVPVTVVKDNSKAIMRARNSSLRIRPTIADVAINVGQDDYIELHRDERVVGRFTSISFCLGVLFNILLLGLLVAIAITFAVLQGDGVSWMNETGQSLLDQQKFTLVTVSQSQGNFAQTYFQQISLELLSSSTFIASVLDGSLNNSAFPTDPTSYLPSYSIDAANPFSSSTNEVTSNYSSYFIPSDAGCQLSNTCATIHDAVETKRTSLVDIKLKASFYASSSLSFTQFGINQDGFTRRIPYGRDFTTAAPTTCLITDTTNTQCSLKFNTSSCSPQYVGPTFFHPYDPRCRSWYSLGRQNAPSDVIFDYPRTSSSGLFVLTAVTALRESNSLTSALIGVVNSNFLMASLSDRLNTIRILSSGYVYIVDTVNPGMIIVHPRASSTCSNIQCTEGFSTSEYASFTDNFLRPLTSGILPQGSLYNYKKHGSDWVLSCALVTQGTVRYALISTVSMSDVLESENDIKRKLNEAVNGLIATFVIVVVVFFFLFRYISNILIQAIVVPIRQLQDVLNRVKNSDLSGRVPATASSSDLKLLLIAVSNLMIALRFDSDSYARGNQTRAREVFSDALGLFTTIGSKRGIGASLNNLAAVETQANQFATAKQLYSQAIANADDLANENGLSDEKANRLRRVRSDRKGNLAVCLLEEGKFAEAFNILENVLLEDKQNFYIRGCVVKQGTLGQYYLKQKELTDADRIFTSALHFLRSIDESAFTPDQWNRQETQSAEQIALANMAYLAESRELSHAELETAYILALTHSPVMHSSTTKSMLTKLMKLKGLDNADEAKRILELAANFSFILDSTDDGKTSGLVSKNVMFSIDISGSMAGEKLRAAIDNVNTIVDKYIFDEDCVGITVFNHVVQTIFPLSCRVGYEERISSLLYGLSAQGGTAVYDAILSGCQMLETQRDNKRENWLIALTDGADGGSRTNVNTLCQLLATMSVKLIVIGVGEVDTALLTRIVSSTNPPGMYFAAKSDKSSIDQTFVKVAAAIQGQLILEEF